MNLHSLGMRLTETLRPSVAGHSVRLIRNGYATAWFKASSPPHGQQILTGQGYEISEMDRVFYFRVSDISALGVPQRGDCLETSKGQIYRLRPQAGQDECWAYHGQHETSFMVIGRRDY